MVARYPAVVLIDLAITLFPTIKRALGHAHPLQDPFGGHVGVITPAMNVIDDRIADVVGNPNSV